MAPSIRLLIAVLVAPVATSVLLVTGGTLLTGCFGDSCPASAIGPIVGISVRAGVIIGIPATVIGGLPAHHVLVRTRRTHAGFYVLAGALVGLPTAIAAVVLMSSGAAMLSLGGWGITMAFSAVAGALSALLFWLIRRPDRDAKPNPPTSAS